MAAAAEAGRAAGRAAAAAEAAVDRRVLAAVATVWLAFDGIPPEDEVQLVLAGGRGWWLPTFGMEADRLARARELVAADSDEERWARRPMLQLPVVPALKDLGVAQGLGVEAKELQAERARTAFSRLELVGRLGLPRSALGRLVGASALTAGMYGAACHVYDNDHLPSLRNWVLHALYRGSRFAQVRLFMHLALPCPQADPWRVALRKGWHACRLVRQEWGEERFWRIWAGTSKDGPLLSFKRLLLQLPRAGQCGATEGGGRERQPGGGVSGCRAVLAGQVRSLAAVGQGTAGLRPCLGGRAAAKPPRGRQYRRGAGPHGGAAAPGPRPPGGV